MKLDDKLKMVKIGDMARQPPATAQFRNRRGEPASSFSATDAKKQFGRVLDMVLRGGYNIYSVEVESALFEHPDIAEVAVVGVPHAVLGHDVCAIVRLREGAPALTLDDLRAFVVDRLADYKRPRRLVVRAEPLPRTGMGKVDKARLLAELS